MKEKLNTNIIDSITNENLKDLAVDNLEILLDKTLEEGVLKEIPIIGSIINIYKAGKSVKENYFLKNLVKFLSSISNIPISQRIDFWKKINRDSNKKDEIGGKIILAIDKIDDSKKADWIGEAFRFLIFGKIKIVEFYDLLYSIERFKAHYEMEFFEYAKYFFRPDPKYLIDHFLTCEFISLSRTTFPGRNSFTHSNNIKVSKAGSIFCDILFELNKEVIKARRSNFLVRQLNIIDSKKINGLQEQRVFTKSELITYFTNLEDNFFKSLSFNSEYVEFNYKNEIYHRTSEEEYKLFLKVNRASN